MNDENSSIKSAHTQIVVVLIIIVIGSLGYLAVSKKGANQDSKDSATTSQPDKSKYQAVFLTNGQVYFGKLADDDGNYVKLADIFYLQAQEKVQPKEDETDNKEPNLTLIKLGKELHAPADEMNIARTQVLFWENIQDDGKVMQAIKDYKSGNGN